MPSRSVLLIKSRDLGWGELSASLAELSDIRIVGEPTDAERGRDLATALRPDVILSASRVGGVSMPRLLVDLQGGPCLEAKIVLLDTSVEPADLDASADLRLAGWLLWPHLSIDGLRQALMAVLLGEFLVASRPVVDALFVGQRRPPADVDLLPALTPREHVVLRLLAEGGTRKTIAAAAAVSPRTVDRVVADLGSKLDAPTRSAIIAKGSRLALLDES